MIDYLNGNMIFVKQDKDGLFVQTPTLIDYIDTEITYIKDAVVNDKLIGCLESYTDYFSGKIHNNVYFFDLSTSSVYKYNFGEEPIYGLFCYDDILYVFTERNIYFITKGVKTSKAHNFVLKGFDLVNPYTFIILDVSDVPTVCLFSIVELFKFKDESDYKFSKTSFASVYIPNVWFDYNNLIFKDGYIYVRGQNGLSILKLNYVGLQGLIIEVEKMYNTYKPLFQDELYNQGINLLRFFRKINNSVYWFVHEKTNRNVFMIDDFFVLGDFGVAFDRNWFFDWVDNKFYRYSFSSELGSLINYKKCFLSYLLLGKVFKGIKYDVFESLTQNFSLLVISMLRKQERGYNFLLDVDKKEFCCNIYGESFVLNLFFANRTRMKIKEIRME
jgi:hypothetical protein